MEWISPNQGNILSEVEGNIIEPIRIEINGSENYEITKISGNFPNGISLNKDDEGYFLAGTLDLVEETTIYYFTLQAKNIDTEEFIQRWFSIEVITLNTEWNNEDEDNFEEYEKTYFSYQFKLKNPEGNEVYKKISGELPEGVFLSETGLLYGVPEEDRTGIFEFIIGIYRNDNLILSSPKITIKVDDLSLLNKPVWATDAGIIGYIDYNDEKMLFIKAFDPQGRTVYYEKSNELFNFPLGLSLDEETGVIYGVCETRSTQEWFFKVTPYVLDNDEKIYGDDRVFSIISNAVESDSLITWITNELPNAKIGFKYNEKLLATSESSIYYELSSGSLPDGLKLSRNGYIYGIPNYQNIGEYSFIIRAYTYGTFKIKQFTINVEKGLSQNAVDVALYINKENDEEYYKLLSKYDKSSSYNSSNYLYKIKSRPEIYIATLNTWDDILLKYKFEQFNTPIDIIWKETKKKTFYDLDNNPKFDFFYKDFDEIYKDSEEWRLKLHTDNETIMEDSFGNKFRPGYIRDSIDKDNIRIEYLTIDGNVIEDIENIKEEVQEDKTRYYYVDPKTLDEYLIQDPKYYIGEEEIDPKIIDDYAEFSRLYIEDGDEKIYVQPIQIGRFYEKESLKIVPMGESVYVKAEIIDDKEIIKKYILKNNEEIEVLQITNEDEYCSYNPNGEGEIKYIRVGDYSEIKKTAIIDNYYKFTSPTETCKPASIEAIRSIFKEEFKPTKFNDSLYYKISNQEIIYNGSNPDDFYNREYKLKYYTDEDCYKIEYQGEEAFLFVRAKNDIDDVYRTVYALVGNEYKPLLIKSSAFDGDVDFVYYTVYLKDREFPLTNLLFTCDWDESIKLTCEYDSEKNVYQWFRIGQWSKPKEWVKNRTYNIGDMVLYEDNIYTCLKANTPTDDDFDVSLWKETNRYIYNASDEENEDYGFDKNIILPNITTDNIDENGMITFLINDEELLPEYMETILDGKVIKEYKPTLPLFYGTHRSHDTRLKEINAYEKEGNWWYGRKFVFYEVHFTPKYLNKDSFTIDFYDHKNPNSPEFLLI